MIIALGGGMRQVPLIMRCLRCRIVMMYLRHDIMFMTGDRRCALPLCHRKRHDGIIVGQASVTVGRRRRHAPVMILIHPTRRVVLCLSVGIRPAAEARSSPPLVPVPARPGYGRLGAIAIAFQHFAILWLFVVPAACLIVDADAPAAPTTMTFRRRCCVRFSMSGRRCGKVVNDLASSTGVIPASALGFSFVLAGRFARMFPERQQFLVLAGSIVLVLVDSFFLVVMIDDYSVYSVR
mmetsp:Transcript_30082/g.72656  ORF Transcript_30082/g.72656 Transcript_30082/m.72656 type:complete len:237 (-) Transcript_30082:173-883(-)